MRLDLRLEKTDFRFQIKNYAKAAKKSRYEAWCKTDLVIRGEEGLFYRLDGEETMLPYEVEALRDKLDELLRGELREKAELKCMEPDLEFCFCPETKGSDLRALLYVACWKESGGLSEDRLTLVFDRENSEKLLRYLKLVTGSDLKGEKK